MKKYPRVDTSTFTKITRYDDGEYAVEFFYTDGKAHGSGHRVSINPSGECVSLRRYWLSIGVAPSISVAREFLKSYKSEVGGQNT